LYRGRNVFFIAKKELFRNALGNWFFTYFMKSVPVNGSVGPALDVIKKGKLLCIFPEGQRTLTGKMNKPRKGVGVLALLSEVPVIPVAITSFSFWPRIKKFPQWKRGIRVVFGKPMHFEPVKAPTRAQFRSLAKTAMEVIQRLKSKKN